MSKSKPKAVDGADDSQLEEALQRVIEADVDGLLDVPAKAKRLTEEGRLRRAFREIVEFRRVHGRVPDAQTVEIAERKLGARLDGLRADDEKVEAVRDLDEFGLLESAEAPTSIDEVLMTDELDLLGDDSGILDLSDLPIRKKPDAPDSIARRKKAADFDVFEPLFKAKHAELSEGLAQLIPFPGVHTIMEGNFFVLNGVMLFVAEVGETTKKVVGGKQEQKQRLRVVFENGTESSLYRQSLSIRLHEQEGLAVANSGDDDLVVGDADTESGHIYVLRSLSEDPQIAGIKDLHKIGFSTTPVETRIANAEKLPTYLMAPVEIVEDYRVYNLKPSTLEHLLHRVFAEVRLDITQIDPKRREYEPSEWFVVPRRVINQAVSMIVSGEIVDYVYAPEIGRLVERDS